MQKMFTKNVSLSNEVLAAKSRVHVPIQRDKPNNLIVGLNKISDTTWKVKFMFQSKS